MFRITSVITLLILYQFILIKAENIQNLIRGIQSQIAELRTEENFKNLLKDGGIFNCDNTYCSQISLISAQTKKNQIQKFPQINFLNDDSYNYIVAKIFLKHNFPLDSTNYKSGLKGISDIIYSIFYSYEEYVINEARISPSSFGSDLLVYLPLYISDELKNKILSISGQNPDMDIEDWINYDIFDPNSKIYNDICYPITFSFSAENADEKDKDSYKNLDMTLEQRKKHFFPGNLQLCPSGCSYQGIDKVTISSVCQCNNEYFSSIQGEEGLEHEEYIEFDFDQKDFYDSNTDIYFSLNALKCLKLPFTSEGFKNNYGNFIILIIAIIVIACFFILIFIGKEHLINVFELLCNSDTKSRKVFKNDDIEINSLNKFDLNDINTKAVSKDPHSKNDLMISIYGKNGNNNNTNTYLYEKKNNPPKKKYSLIGDGILIDTKKSSNKKIIEGLMKEEEKNENENENEIKTDNQDELLKQKEYYENEIKQLKEKNDEDLKKLRQEKDKEIKKLKKDLEKKNAQKPKENIYHDKYNDTEIDGLRITLPLSSLFTDQEINAMNLEQSLKYDKRSFFLIYYSFINMKQPLFFLFNYYTSYKKPNFQIKLNSLRIIILCYELMIYLFLYSTFFGSKSISKIFYGNFNLGKKIVFGIILAPFCMIIKSVMQYFILDYMNKQIIEVKLKCYSFFILEKNKLQLNNKQISNNDKEAFTNIKNVDDNGNLDIQISELNNKNYKDKKKYLNNEFIYCVQDLIDVFKKKLFIFFGLSILVIFFEWCVVASFCSVYKNSQIEFFLSIIVCYLEANIISFIYCFIPTTFRYFAIKNNSSLIFKIAEIAKII